VFRNKFIHIGTFGKPVGLKGEINIIMFTNSMHSFQQLKPFFAEDKSTIWDLQLLRMSKRNMIGKLKNHISRTSVEQLYRKKIFAHRKKFPKTKTGEFYMIDLIDCKIQLKNNKIIGHINRIDNFGAGDLINVKSLKGNDYYIPMNEDNIISIDLKKNIVVINPIKGILN